MFYIKLGLQVSLFPILSSIPTQIFVISFSLSDVLITILLVCLYRIGKNNKIIIIMHIYGVIKI